MQNACLVGLCYKHVSGAYITVRLQDRPTSRISIACQRALFMLFLPARMRFSTRQPPPAPVGRYSLCAALRHASHTPPNTTSSLSIEKPWASTTRAAMSICGISMSNTPPHTRHVAW